VEDGIEKDIHPLNNIMSFFFRILKERNKKTKGEDILQGIPCLGIEQNTIVITTPTQVELEQDNLYIFWDKE